MILTNETRLRLIPLDDLERRGWNLMVHRDGPNWLAVDGKARAVLELFDGKLAFGEVVGRYAACTGFEHAKAWQHVETVARDAIRQKVLLGDGEEPGAIGSTGNGDYHGREPFLETTELKELWIHTNNSCNLECSHCLVSSGPLGDTGLPGDKIIDLIVEARGLGAKRFHFTGGEPFLRRDLFDLADEMMSDPQADLTILTNGLLLNDRRIERLGVYDRDRLILQVSLDGSTPELNDPIRGSGSFRKITGALRRAVAGGLNPTLTTAITRQNAGDVSNITRLAGEIGIRNHHLLWLHRRGRAMDGNFEGPENAELIDVVREAVETGARHGVTIDNFESHKSRLRYPAGTRRDLASAGVRSLCVYSDGKVYPSAAMANVPELLCGSVHETDLGEILRSGEVPRRFRAHTVMQKDQCRECPLKFICGGGDVEHAYFYGGSPVADDPYCDLHKAMIYDAMADIAADRDLVVSNGKSGYNAPVIVTGMGDGGAHCAVEESLEGVVTNASECVRSWDLDAPRRMVRRFYGDAAEKPQEDLCCPVQPSEDDLAHIPREVVERFYGCGSPIDVAALAPGETMLDLGSGAGIDVFRAAKRVGPTGRAIGVDMTDSMLEVAEEARVAVAKNLGFDVVEFRKGFLEEIPAPDRSIDLVTSNCVINLSPDKRKVLWEMWRILNDHGRMVISDIVSEEELPVHQRQDPRLWGECISGALTEEELLSYFERAGFYGIQVLSRSFWREVEGHRFFSVTVRGYKYEKKAGCVYDGRFAVYKGPFKGVSDEEGHWFPRNVPVEVCTDTAAKLERAPYRGMFLITRRSDDVDPDFACCGDAGGDGGACCP